MISEKVHKLCTSNESVSALLAQDPTLAPADAWKRLYGGHAAGEKESASIAKPHRDNHTPRDLQRAFECGNWGPTRPSELFLKMYHDALCTLDHSISGCMVSPSLMGSCGTMPLTVISVVPDIMRHMSNLIVRAEREVILATNYWQNSVASEFITNAMKESSRRAGERGQRIVFKLEYDRGSPKQLLENHYLVSEKEYLGKAVALPTKEEIPHLDLQVMNYHKPMVGTFHCKYMIVDRKFAVLQSNNIQDNDNMEMMTHLEGPIVDSLYDMALLSWSKKLEPPLPSHNSPAVHGGLGTFGNKSHDGIFDERGAIRGHTAVVHPGKVPKGDSYKYERRPVNQPGFVHPGVPFDPEHSSDATVLAGPTMTESTLRPVGEQEVDGINGITDGVQRTGIGQNDSTHHGFEDKDLHRVEVFQENARAAATTGDIEHIVHSRRGDTRTANGTNDTAKQNGQATTTDSSNGALQQNGYGQANGRSSGTPPPHGVNGPDSRTQEFLAAGARALPRSQIKKPSPSNSLPEHTTDDPHYDVDIAGEVARVQTAVSPKPGESRNESITRHLNHTRNIGFKGTAPECEPNEEMTPYIPHPVHEPCPMALVCREPFGQPTHRSVYNPQNEVWLSALRNATKSVFVQSPTLNAGPLVPAIIEACERGIDVYCFICLGYNDTGELLPHQGGTNEMIAHKMYISLSKQAKQRLHYFFYVGKDQTYPIVAKKKKRDCHVKVMIVDEHIGIQGNGNQDTQSWYHSQEINVMLDSELICRAWIDGLRRNQNTHLYGEVSKEDGVWRDENGKQASDVIGVDPGRFSWAKGFMGAINRVRGTGDF